MMRLVMVLVSLVALTAWSEPPPFVVLGSKEVRKTATGYRVTKPDGSRVDWREGSGGRWTNGKETYIPTRYGWNLQGRGEVFTRLPSYWSMRTTNGTATVFTSPNGLRLGETEYRYTANGGSLRVP